MSELSTIYDPFALPGEPPEEFSISISERDLSLLRSDNQARELQTRMFQVAAKLNGLGYEVCFEHDRIGGRHTLKAKRF